MPLLQMLKCADADIIAPEAESKLMLAPGKRSQAVRSRRQVRHLKGVGDLERELDKQSLHSVIARIQLKDMLTHLFSFKRRSHA